MTAPSVSLNQAQNNEQPISVPGFFLLFSNRLPPVFNKFSKRPDGFAPLPETTCNTLNRWRAAAQSHVLGPAFIQSDRLAVHPLGRIDLGGSKDQEPCHADVCLITHVAGVALWEVWIPAPRQSFSPELWINWLDINQTDSMAERVWQRLSTISQSIAGTSDYDDYYPLSVIRLPDIELAGWLDAHAEQVVSLLWRDQISRPLKTNVVIDELARDTCPRVGGINLIGRRSALDLHDLNDKSNTLEAEALDLPPRSAFPFLITVELLCIERAVLQGLYDRLTHAGPHSIDDLLTLKKEVMDGLEEFYGATLASTRFNDIVAEQGDAVLGIADLFDAVTDRLDMVSITLTTEYQQRMTALQCWLTVVFGATEIGFIAASLATWYYRSGLGVVLAWTVGAAVLSGGVLVTLLRCRLRD